MTSPEQVLSEFIDAWNAGERPKLMAYLERVPPADRDGLAESIGDWMAIAPTPNYSPATLATIRAEPAVQRALAATSGSVPLATEIPRLRARRALSVRQLATKVVEAVGLGSGHVDQTEDYLQRTERGELSTAGFSRRLLDALAGALEVPASALANAAAATLPPPPAAAGGMSFRAAGKKSRMRAEQDLDALAAAARAPAPAPFGEVDRLFLGGPDA